ncbi:MAG: D-alanine--D-alanine ligase [Candidatus Hydrogenedentes bacterium]|nr:D-alanine--D-alanine ligase [Candidatus Hydrogenedentota bacterium]
MSEGYSSPLTVGVLMGGISSEHEVSLLSGEGVIRALKELGYEPLPIKIRRDFIWEIGTIGSFSIDEALCKLKKLNLSAVFIALHGAFGEDGRIQGVLDWLGIPYTGSGCSACSLAMNKVRAKAVVKSFGVRVAEHLVFHQENWTWDRPEVVSLVKRELNFPVVIKPVSQGSSVGVSIANDEQQLLNGIEEAFEWDKEIFIEKFIRGTEVTCGIWDCEDGVPPKALPVTEICPKTSRFFDYTAKYTPGATDEITPARLNDELTQKVQEMAITAHKAIGCEMWSRSDFIIDEAGPVWIEINTIPGLTPTSLYPQEAQHAGISYKDMVKAFVEFALRKSPHC